MLLRLPLKIFRLSAYLQNFNFLLCNQTHANIVVVFFFYIKYNL